MRRKVKAFSAPPFVLKAVMAGQVGKCHALSLGDMSRIERSDENYKICKIL